MWQGDVLKAFLLRHRVDILSVTLGTSCPIRICHPGPGTQAASSMPSSDRALNSPSALFPLGLVWLLGLVVGLPLCLGLVSYLCVWLSIWDRYQQRHPFDL